MDAIELLLDDESDQATQCLFWILTSIYHWEGGDFASSSHAIDQSAIHAERSGSKRLIEDVSMQQAIASLSGPAPVAVAVAQFEALLASSEVSHIAKGGSLDRLAILSAMQGEFAKARDQVELGRRILTDLGARLGLAELFIDAAWVERLAGDFSTEVSLLNDATEYAKDIGAAGLIPFTAARTALACARLGRIPEARASLAVAEDDPSALTALICHVAKARLLAAEGRLPDAIEQVEQAAALSAKSAMFVNMQTEIQFELARIAFGSGRRERARSAAQAGIVLARNKGNVVMEQWLADTLAEIDEAGA